MIEQLGFPGYFLIVWDIVEFCRRHDIYCQGRGSAANSAVCYALGITNADAVALGLLFERFLSPEPATARPTSTSTSSRGRREEVIQYVYERYGREHAAQVANVITYRSRSAVRDMGKALGPPDRPAGRLVEAGRPVVSRLGQRPGRRPSPTRWCATWPPSWCEHFPRHLGIHSGGMVICDRPVVEVCPVEWAPDGGPQRAAVGQGRLRGRRAGQVRPARPGHARPRCTTWSTWCASSTTSTSTWPAPDQEPEVYDLLCRADTVGVFQVESRAQMATLPRLRAPEASTTWSSRSPSSGPGPIQGGAGPPLHPPAQRDQEPITYLHPLLEPVLEQDARRAAVPGAAHADGHRRGRVHRRPRPTSCARPWASKRSRRADGRGCATGCSRAWPRGGITGEVAEQIYDKLAAFANFGFPESHSVASPTSCTPPPGCKLHYPAAFTAGLLNAQPMGFWSPQTLVADARRHGVTVRRPDVNAGQADAWLEEATRCRGSEPVDDGPGRAARAVLGARHRGRDGGADRRRAARGRAWRTWSAGPGVTRAQLESLATAGALDGLDPPTRSGRQRDGRRLDRPAVAGLGGGGGRPGHRRTGSREWSPGPTPPPLPAPTRGRRWPTTCGPSAWRPTPPPCNWPAPGSSRRGVSPLRRWHRGPTGDRVTVGGVVTHRQQPESAHGAVFLNLEDETGMVNVVCSRGAWLRGSRWPGRARRCWYVDGSSGRRGR